MIGRLVLSDRNFFKVNSKSARKTHIISEQHEDILIRTNKEFNPKDEYIKLNELI